MPKQFTAQEIERLISRQKTYFMQGNTLSYEFRIRQLNKLKETIIKYEAQLTQALQTDLGKSAFESYTSEIGFIRSNISHTIHHLKRWMKPEKKKMPVSLMMTKSKVIKEPYGCVYIIGPYNYPFQLLIEPLVGAIAAGNCAVLSPSELTPHVAEVTMKLIHEAFSPEYVCCVDGGIENNTLLLHSNFDYIFFTGSVNVGKIVMQAAAEQLIPVTLELGGKSPVIIDKSANVTLACERILWGKLMNAGQTCVAPDYVFVPEEMKAAFLQELKKVLIQFYGQEPKNSRDFGRIVNARHVQRLKNIIETDKAYLFTGGQVDEAERYVAPTVLCPKDFSAACMQEEIFGPILPVIGYTNLEQALSYINQNPKPLALYIFSENKQITESIIEKTSSGGVSVNDTISHIIHPDLPFGGIGTSGMGSYHGVYSFETFSHHRSILKKSTKFHLSLVHPPFNDKKLKNVKMALK